MAKKREINITDLLNWLEGKLDADEADTIEQAVAGEPTHQATVEWLREFLHLSASTQLDTPEAATHRAATEYFRAYAFGARRPGLLQTLRSVLSSDSWQRLSLAGVRNVTLPMTPRQLVYSTPVADIALNILAHDEQLDLSGQVFPTDEEEVAVYTVQLVQVNLPLGLATTDAVGKFSFFALREGNYELVLTADEHEIVIDPLELALKAAD